MWCPSRGAPMSDNLRNAGPAGQPRATAPSSGPLSPPRSLSGRSDEDPTSLMKKRAPWPAPGESPVYGPLSIDHIDEYVSRVFRPPDPAAKAIELKLERIRLKRGRYQLKSAVEQLARDQKEVEGLVEQLKRLQEPQRQPQRRSARQAIRARRKQGASQGTARQARWRLQGRVLRRAHSTQARPEEGLVRPCGKALQHRR
jgi:hypothetical protein